MKTLQNPHKLGVEATYGWTANSLLALWKVLGGAEKCTSRDAIVGLKSPNTCLLIGLRGLLTRLCNLLRGALFLRV
jgi:hypothetical protein